MVTPQSVFLLPLLEGDFAGEGVWALEDVLASPSFLNIPEKLSGAEDEGALPGGLLPASFCHPNKDTLVT